MRSLGYLKTLFHDLQVDEEFQKLWRSVTVDAMDDAKIDEYLEKQGQISCPFALKQPHVCFTFKFNASSAFLFHRYPLNARSWHEEANAVETKEASAA